MIPVLVLTHGELATELLAAAREIDADLVEATHALALPWDVDSEEAGRELKALLKKLDKGDGVIVLTDMFGGTATNLALPQMEAGRIEIVTGVNLPMLVKLSSLRHQKLEPHDFAMRLRDAGQKSIRVASEFLRR